MLRTRRERIKRRVMREFDGRKVRTAEGFHVVVSRVGDWDLVFDVNSAGGEPSVLFGTPPATRLGIPFTALDGFSLDLTRRGLVGQAIYDRRKKEASKDASAREAAFETIRHRLRTPDLLLGYGEFDYEFSIETNDERRLRDLMADGQLRELLQGHRSIWLKVMQGDEWFGSLVPDLPRDVGVAYFDTGAVLKDMDRIRTIRELLALTMERLVAIKAAAPEPPRVFG